MMSIVEELKVATAAFQVFEGELPVLALDGLRTDLIGNVTRFHPNQKPHEIAEALNPVFDAKKAKGAKEVVDKMCHANPSFDFKVKVNGIVTLFETDGITADKASVEIAEALKLLIDKAV